MNTELVCFYFKLILRFDAAHLLCVRDALFTSALHLAFHHFLFLSLLLFFFFSDVFFFNTLPTQAVRLPVDRNDGLYDTATAIWFSLMRNFHTLTGEMYKSESETCHR